jgi:hypothetical protein
MTKLKLEYKYGVLDFIELIDDRYVLVNVGTSDSCRFGFLERVFLTYSGNEATYHNYGIINTKHKLLFIILIKKEYVDKMLVHYTNRNSTFFYEDTILFFNDYPRAKPLMNCLLAARGTYKLLINNDFGIASTTLINNLFNNTPNEDIEYFNDIVPRNYFSINNEDTAKLIKEKMLIQYKKDLIERYKLKETTVSVTDNTDVTPTIDLIDFSFDNDENIDIEDTGDDEPLPIDWEDSEVHEQDETLDNDLVQQVNE